MAWIYRPLIGLLILKLLNICVPWHINGAVMPPPWANPVLNPCATQPRGWQLLYWPPDEKCYKIFQTGYPCSNDMELSPSIIKSGKEVLAECRCPPKRAQSIDDGKCYSLFSTGPCNKGNYFAPDTKYNNGSNRQWGICVQIKSCPNSNEVFWPADGRCYQKFTKGPCPKGQLITVNSGKTVECKCNKQRTLREYYYRYDGSCYQHFTRGPCKEKGHLFLPDRTCGCHSFLPHFHEETENCFELGTIGPCNIGEIYQLHPETRRGLCQCKIGYIRFKDTSACYRPFTQGPCEINQILINATSCMIQPCSRGYLYFDKPSECFRIGTRGPCPKGRIVTFDFETRPSIDGISYNGVCSCEKHEYNNQCGQNDHLECSEGTIAYEKRCYKLYTQGPCPKGAWITPRRQKKDDLWSEFDDNSEGICECVPGYIRTVRIFNNNQTRTDCASPSVILADYLNKNFSLIS